MAVRSFSHVGITVSDFNRFVTFYWEIFLSLIHISEPTRPY